MSTNISGSISNRIMFSTYQKDYVQPILRENVSKDIIYYGMPYNNYPEFCLSLYRNSSTHNSIIDGSTDYQVGKGLRSASGNKKIEKAIATYNRKNDSLNDVFLKCAKDMEIFGGYCLHIIYGRGSTVKKPIIAEILHADISKFRFNADGSSLKYLNTWAVFSGNYTSTEYVSNQDRTNIIPKDYTLYDPTNPKGEQIFYYAGLNTRDFYPRPRWQSATTNIQSDIEISNFHHAVISSGCFPNLSVNFFNGQPSEEEQAQIEKSFNEKFGSSNKAGKTIFTFSDPGTEGVKITPIEENDSANKFLNLAASVENKIYAAHRANPSLFGIQTAGKLGDNMQLKVSFDIYKKTVIEPRQRELLNQFNKLTGYDLEVIQIPTLLNYFSDDTVLASFLTLEEARQNAYDHGYIKDLVSVDKSQVLGNRNTPNLNNREEAQGRLYDAQAEAALKGVSEPDPNQENN